LLSRGHILPAMREKIEESPEERLERLKAYAAELAAKTDDPLMREKIATILAGKSVNH
jgi:hypothetical protein